MATLAEIRAQYPQYDDMSDSQIADSMYQKFYADMPREDFDAKLQITPASPAQSGGGAAANLAAGANENIAKYAGLPAQVVNAIGEAPSAAGRYVGDKLRELTGKAPISESPEPPPESMGRMSGTPEDIQTGMGRLGFDPRQVEAKTGTDKFARGAGRGLVDALSVAMPATMVSNASKAGTMTSEIAKALAAQPVSQVLSTAAGEGTTDATGSPTAGMAAGMGTALAAGLADNAIRNFASRSATIKAAPTTADLKGEGSALFKKAKGTDVRVSEGSFNSLIDDIKNTLDVEGADQRLHPDVSAAVSAISRRAGMEPNIQNLMTSRQLLTDAAQRAGSDNERRMASMLIDKLDDYVERLGPKDLASGSMGTAPAELTAGRDLWTRMKKSSTIESIMNAAKDSKTGEENGLRNGFRALLKNQKALRSFSPDEIDAIRDVARGNITSNTLNKIGKLGFGSKAQSNFLGGSIGAGAGFHVGGPVGALAVPAAGYVAQKGSEAMTKRAAQYARALTASGSTAAATPSASQVLLNPSRGPNAALLAKVLAEQSNYPALSLLMQRQPQ